MKLTPKIAKLICEMEYLVGKECYNPNSYNGYTDEEGCGYRYPVYICNDNKPGNLLKYRYKVLSSKPDQIKTLKYKFGSNHLFIGKGLINVLTMLEERYGIDFNELEATMKEDDFDI